jgi:pimeloyl-ACP methyl ester carboxylesterase
MLLNFFKWYRGIDPSPKTPFLFLHGLGGTGRIWRAIAASLEEEVPCYAPDQRGHGLSRPVPDDQREHFHALDYAQDLIEFLDRESLNQVHLVGHSMGVRSALALCSLAPNRVKSLLAVDIGISSAWGGGIGEPLATFISRLPRSFPDRTTLREHLFSQCPDPAIAQYLSAVAQLRAGPPEHWEFPFDHDALIRTIHQAHEAPIGQWLRRTLENGIPCLFLRGERSKVWFKPDYEKQKAEYSHPLLKFEEWEDCGHGIPFEQRLRFTGTLKEITDRDRQ